MSRKKAIFLYLAGAWGKHVRSIIDSYPDAYNLCEGFYSCPSYTVVLEVKHNGSEKRVSCYDIVYLDRAESYQKFHPDIWENISKEGKNFIILHDAIMDMLTSSAEWKALPDYDIFLD